MTLDPLGAPFSPDTHYEQQIEPFQTSYQRVNAWAQSKGLPSSVAVPQCRFPSLDLPEPGSPSDVFVSCYDENTAWHSYLTALKGEMKALLEAADNVKEITWGQLWDDYRKLSDGKAKRGTVGALSTEDIKAKILTNGRYQRALLHLQELKQKVATIDALLSAINRNIQALSRSVTLRGQDLFHNLSGNQASTHGSAPGNRGRGGAPSFDNGIDG